MPLRLRSAARVPAWEENHARGSHSTAPSQGDIAEDLRIEPARKEFAQLSHRQIVEESLGDHKLRPVRRGLVHHRNRAAIRH
jgi:hypothetical protein